MSVFKRQAGPADAAPASVLATMRQFADASVAAELRPGNANAAASRRALVGVGAAKASLYLVPTDSGSLCMLWAPDAYGGGCTQGFDAEVHAVYLHGQIGGHPYVWGILKDDVVGVSAVVDSSEVPVAVGKSAFFYQGDTLPTALTVHLADGSTETLPVAALPGALK